MNTRRNSLPLAFRLQLRQIGRRLFGLLRRAWDEYQRDYAGYYAGAMVYFALVSLIPLLLLLLSALGLLLRYSVLAAEAQQQVLRSIESRFGAELRTVIEPLLDSLRQQSVIATAISVITLLVTASVLFRQLRLSFRAIWKQPPPLVAGSLWAIIRHTIREQVIAYLMVLGSGLLLVAALTLISAGWWLNNQIDYSLFNSVTGWLLTDVSPFVLAAGTFAMLFRFLPPITVRWRDAWLAALLCAAAYTIAGEALSLYGAYFNTNRTAYGALGGLLVVMLWMNIVGQILFFGAELCRVAGEGYE